MPPVNRQLKPQKTLSEDKTLETAAKSINPQQHSPNLIVENLSQKLITTNLQSPSEPAPLKPPSVDRKLKPNAFKVISFKIYFQMLCNIMHYSIRWEPAIPCHPPADVPVGHLYPWLFYQMSPAVHPLMQFRV